MKFPVLYENGTWPSTHRCPQCDKLALLSPHPMAILAGGALRVKPRQPARRHRARLTQLESLADEPAQPTKLRAPATYTRPTSVRLAPLQQ